jgi:hypothetical protein
MQLQKMKLESLELEKSKAYIQLMCAMLSNPAIVEKEENFSVHGDAMLQRMRGYALQIVEDLFPDSETFTID